MKTRALIIRDGNNFRTIYPILPNVWRGECDCVVGPFANQQVAEYFANRVVDFGHYDAFSQKVFAKRDAFYVEVKQLLGGILDARIHDSN